MSFFEKLKEYITEDLFKYLGETIEMVFVTVLIALVFGLLLGLVMFYTNKSKKKGIRILYKIIDVIVGILRSFPFYVLMFFVVPFTRVMMSIFTGKSQAFSTEAFIVPLTIAAIPFFAKLFENSLKETNNDILEVGEALGLNKHRSYDRFLSLAKSEKQLSYEEAKDLFYKSIERFPEDFQKKAHEVSKEGVVDVYPSDGKRTGAYSSGGGGIFPHILLNFLGTLDDAFTLAHESGHSIHTLYSMESQPILKQNYTIFVAEIASTFNEHNLLDYLLKTGDLSKEDKIALLQKEIDEIAATFYRQTLFAEYELKASQLVEEGKQINYQVLSDIMTSLYKDYYGIDITEEVYKPLVWCYIPHLFYSPFYVYQYATSFATSLELYKRVNNNVPGAFDKYIGLLKSGGSAFPIDQVKAAGVDLTTKEPFQAVVKRMDELVRKLEELLND